MWLGMRKPALTLCVLLVALAAPAGAQAHQDPFDHGPDPAAIDAGPETPAPAGGPDGATFRSAGSGPIARAASVRAAEPSAWCGDPLATTDNTTDEVDNGTYRYHAIYAIPSDGVNRLGAVAGTLQTDAFQASGLLERLYGRALRFDMGTTCGAGFLDITTVRLAETSQQLKQLAGTGNGTLEAVARNLDDQGFPTVMGSTDMATITSNYVVWLDGPGPSSACGQAFSYEDARRKEDNLNNAGGKVAVVFQDGKGFCGSNTVRHEIGHTLGALKPNAPNAFDGAHCDDAREDTMCAADAPAVSSGDRGLFFDYKNDDYWDPPNGAALPWWTANLNRFVCPDVNCNVQGGSGGAGPQTTAPPDDAAPARTKAKPLRLKTKVRRSKNRRKADLWNLSLRVSGQGRARVDVRCRKRKTAKISAVLVKSFKLPRTVRSSVRCATKPTASARKLG
jgi:hypothetical protein